MTIRFEDIETYITETFEGVDTVVASDASFFFYNPASSAPPDHRFPFVTLVTSDAYDQFSDLNRPSVFRLNIGLSKPTFRALFGAGQPSSQRDSVAEDEETPGDYDFTALDQVMPHPVYGRMYWVCVLNPGEETFATRVRPLLAEAYELAVSRYQRREELDRTRASQ
ncbi:MAG TPA: DUF6194 family protein [Ktedonobacterales bacterium]|nr:DUF6194 family protein [Ktedonobacterales bacterium]